MYKNIKQLGILRPLLGRGSKLTYSEQLPYILENNVGNLIAIPCDSFETFNIPIITNNSSTFERNNNNCVNTQNLVEIRCTTPAPSASLSLINCRSVRNKADYICDFIVENNFECVALTETWLIDDDQDSATLTSLVPDGYRILHVPRTGGKGGGVAFICKKHYNVKIDETFKASSFENMIVNITIESYTFRVFVIYRIPPSPRNKICKSTFLKELADLLEQHEFSSGKHIILGDFNINWDVL